MLVKKDYMDIISPEELAELLPGKNKDIYEDEAEDLLDQIREQDAFHPVAAWKKLTVTAIDQNTVALDGMPFRCAALAGKAVAGSTVYGIVCTAGDEMHQILKETDDVMQSYLLGFLMSHVLDMGIAAAAEAVSSEIQQHASLVIPGIEGVCSLGEQKVICAVMPEEFSAVGVSVLADGRLTPGYSSAMLLLMEDGEKNLPENWENMDQRTAFVNTLMREGGHV